MKTCAVLTGDIIGSSQLGPERLKEAMTLLRHLAGEFEQACPGSVVGSPDIFRGDAWQLCLRRPSLAITAAVFIRAGCKADDFDTRIGIGWGAVERLNPDRITESIGPAFTRSGAALDGLGKVRLLAVAHADAENAGASDMLAAGVDLLDVLISQWTQRESVAVYGSLRKLPQEAIADLPQARTKEGKPPTRQTIQDALHRVSWAGHIQPFLSRAERFLEREVEA